MKTKSIYPRLLFALFVATFCFVETIQANQTTYFARARAAVSTATTATGSGKVYASTATTNNPTYGAGNTVTKNQTNNTNFTFYMYAQADDGSEFVGWSTTATGNPQNNSSNNPYQYTVTSNAESENNATVNTLYAVFRALPTFYFSANAVARVSAGGTASVSLPSSARGEHWNSTSATTTAQFTATANAGYEFVGWYSDTGLTTQVSTNSSYSQSITSESTSSANPANLTLYARFEPKPTFYFSATAEALPAGTGTASVSPTTASAQAEHWNSTSATTTAIAFSATQSSENIFLGWSETASGAIVSTANPYNPTLTSTSTSSVNPTNSNLFARYQAYATSITASPSQLTVYVGQTSSPITHTVSPTGAYDEHTTYESANTAIATVDASGVVTGVATGTTTITIKSLKNDNSTVAASTTITVTVKNKVATPEINFEVGNDGIKAVIACATLGYKIYYTINDGTPTTSSTEYTAPFSVVEGDEIKAIAVKDPADANWDNSDVASAICSLCTTDAPKITFEGNSSTGKATVTITANTGETIYYTSGNAPADPTTSSYDGTGTSPVTINNVDAGTTFKAIAKNTTCLASSVVSKDIAFSYVAGGTVVLNDYEDHNWSYYSDSECPIRSLSPADVKITYYGDGIVMTGNNDYNASSTDFVKPGQNNYTGGAKVNVGDENENTFIYYKTLERGDATQTAWTFSSGNQSSAASRCPYTPIPNPFQVRPTYGTPPTSNRANWTGWRGFQCWRLKSVTGGAVYSAASGGTALSTNAVINAETEIYFAPNSEYGMEVELEAVWAIAYIVYANNNGNWSVPNHAGLGYERNFVVLASDKDFYFQAGNGNNTAYISNVNRPSTITSYLPNGTSGNQQYGRVQGVYNNNANNRNITLQANTKFENVQFSNMGQRYLTAAGNNLIVGRGCSGTVGTVRGLSDNTSGAVEYAIRLESGTFGTFNMIDGTTRTHSGTVSAKTVFGCDYDRAKSDNNKLSIGANNTVYGASQYQQFTSNTNRNNLTYDWRIKSGKVQASKGVAAGSAAECIYMGNSGSNNDSDGNRYQGKRRMIMEGGEVCNIAGGLNNYGNNYANYIVNDGWALQIRIQGGTVRGSVYGAAEFAGASGDRQFIITGGTINGWVAGGANGTHNDGGELYGSTALYIGGTAVIGSESGGTQVGGYNASYGTNGADGGNVFGAGCGIYPTNGNFQTGTVGRVNNSVVAIADETTIWRDVYGGGNYGWVRDNGTTGIYILGGTVNGSVFGGSNNQQGQEVAITMKGGIIKGNTIGDATKTGGLYGGSNSWGTINDNVTMNINGGQVGTSSKPANIHGGGYGQSTIVSGNVDITLGTTTQTTSGAVVYGDVYGGSALGSVNGTSANTTYHTYVTLNKGTINGSLYGGALGSNTVAANVYGPVQVKVYGGSVKKTDANGANGSGGVYGANNISGAPQRSVTVDIYGTDPAPSANEYALYAVYGGGNNADYTYGNGYPTVTVHNCDNSIEYVYGGGNAAAVAATDVTIYGGNVIGNVFGGGNGTVTAANVNGNATTKIYGGTILKVFGGSNSQGTISGAISVTAESRAETNGGTPCPMQVDELYGGGNMAASNVGSITIGCMNADDMINYVYGGSNNAQITGNVNLTMTGGRVGNLFGGNNTGNSINGTITVTVDWGQASCTNNYLGNVFGGGNQAVYTAPAGSQNYPKVDILNGTVSGDVFGGGYGDANDATKGVVNGNPQVTINGANTVVSGGVYGGGSLAPTNGSPVVTQTNGSTTNIFGGGKAAGITGSPVVNINGGSVSTGVYGGCDSSGTVDGDIVVNLTGGTVGTTTAKGYVHGGGYGSATATTGNIDVNVNGTSLVIYGDVYGGSALGQVNSDTNDYTHVTLDKGTIHGDAYGGGLGDDTTAANVNGNVKVTQNGVAFVKRTTQIDANTSVVTGGRIFGCNNLNGSPKGTVLVLVNKTQGVTGQQRTTAANLHSDDNSLHSYELSAVYGGGNLAAYLPNDATATGQYAENGHVATQNPLQVIVNGCDDVSIEYVYGGGNAAATPSTDVLVLGAYELSNVFGGGNGKDKISRDGTTWTNNPGADVGIDNNDQNYGSGVSSATIWGGVVHSTFGGSNTLGNIRTRADLTIDENGSCPLELDEVYGGGNEAYMAGNAGITLGCISYLREIYGGAKNADVGSDVTLTITSGHFDRVFGGNNIGGKIMGSITVNIEETGCNPITIGELYGCGNQAAYNVNDKTGGTPSADPVINIKSFTSIGNVFGGGLGSSARVTGNPIVNINEVVGANATTASTYAGTTRTMRDGTQVELPAHTSGTIGAIGTIYGGGNAAPVVGNTFVNIGTAETITYVSGNDHSAKTVKGVSITGNVFGGGLGETATVSGNTNVQVGRKIQ